MIWAMKYSTLCHQLRRRPATGHPRCDSISVNFLRVGSRLPGDFSGRPQVGVRDLQVRSVPARHMEEGRRVVAEEIAQGVVELREATIRAEQGHTDGGALDGLAVTGLPDAARRCWASDRSLTSRQVRTM